jgi:hypothetical protein
MEALGPFGYTAICMTCGDHYRSEVAESPDASGYLQFLIDHEGRDHTVLKHPVGTFKV